MEKMKRKSFKLLLRRASDAAIESFASETEILLTEDTVELQNCKIIIESLKEVSKTLKSNANNAWHVIEAISNNNKNGNSVSMHKEFINIAPDDTEFKSLQESLRSKGLVTNVAAQEYLPRYVQSIENCELEHCCKNNTNHKSSSVASSSDCQLDYLIKKEKNGYKWHDPSALQSSKKINIRSFLNNDNIEQ